MRLESMATTKILRLMFLLHFHVIRSSTQGLPCHTASGDNCTSSICPNTVVNYTCTISGTPRGFTDWILNETCTKNPFPNKIRLSQIVNGLCSFQQTNTCGPYTAFSLQSAFDPTYCLSSILTVTVTAAMDGNTVTCSNTDQFNSSITTVVSMANISVIAPPGPARIPVKAPLSSQPSQLTVTWTPPTTGGVPTSYNVTINDNSSPVVIADNGSLVYTHTFTGLISDTPYTVSVVAINCAGTSNVTSQNRSTVANPPEGNNTRIMFISDMSKITQLRITWTPVGGSVTMYIVRVVGDGTFVGQGNASCSAVVCLLIMYPEKSVIATKYNVFLASINGYGDVGPESNSTISVVNHISAVNSKVSTASIQCSFQNNQSLYCVVCCSTDLSVPPDSSVYNISTTRGTEVTVDLNGLISVQTYYCKAAPTNDSSSQNCTFSGFEGVNTIISFKTMSLPQDGTNTENRGTITVAISLGIVLPTTAIITAVTVAVIVFSAIYFRRKSKAKGERYHTPTTTQAQYEDVGVPKIHSERVNRPVQTDVTESTLYSTPYDKRRKTQSDEAHNSTSGVAWHTYSVLEGPDMTRNGLTEKEMVNRILGTKQQVPGHPHWHTKEPATEGSLDTGVSARKCIPGDGVYALPMDHIASNALPTEHRDNSSDGYALPVDHRATLR